MLALLLHPAQPVAAITVCACRTGKLAVRYVDIGVQGNPVGHRMPSARCCLCMAPEVHQSSLPERSRVRLLPGLLPLLQLLPPLRLWLLLCSTLQILLPLIKGSCKSYIGPCLLPLKPTCSSRGRQLLLCALHWSAGGGHGSSCPLRYGSSACSSSCPLLCGSSACGSSSSQLPC